MLLFSNPGCFVFGRYSRIGALLLSLGPIAGVQGQDSPRLTRALERADRFDAAIGPKPQPTAKWLGGDRLAYSPEGKGPWTVLEAATSDDALFFTFLFTHCFTSFFTPLNVQGDVKKTVKGRLKKTVKGGVKKTVKRDVNQGV